MHSYHHPLVQLKNEEIWAEFNKFTQENILTRTGRRLFPSLEVLISNLDPSSIYDIYVDFIERGRYAWIQSKWVQTNSASLDTDSCYYLPVQQHQAYLHEDSPNCGRFWMAAPISFACVKATNRRKDLQSNQVALKPMHKYEPRIQIVQRQSLGQANQLVHSQTFPIASFIAVTKYQNEEITQLKIKRNPFARVFFWRGV